MDLGGLFHGIGDFLGGIFGGSQKKQQNKPQQPAARPSVAPAQHNVLPINGPAASQNTVKLPDPFALPTPVQAPVLGGVHHAAPAPKPTVAMPTNPFPLSAQDLSSQFQAQRQQEAANAAAPARGDDPIGHFVHDATTSLLDRADPSKALQTGVSPTVSVPLSLIKGGIDGIVGSGIHIANDFGANVGTNIQDPLTRRLLGISNGSEGDTRTAGHDIATSIDASLGDGKGNGLSKAPQPVQDAFGIGNDVLNLSQLGGFIKPAREAAAGAIDVLSGAKKADAAILSRDPSSPITANPNTGKAPAITSPNRPEPTPAPKPAEIPPTGEPVPAPGEKPVVNPTQTGVPTEESKIPVGGPETPTSTTDIVKNPNTVPNLPDRVKLLSSKENAIRATKTDAGNELADRMVGADARHTELRAGYMHDLKPVFDLNKKDFRDAWDIQEGKLDPSKASPAAAKAAETLKKVMPQVQKDADAAGAINGDLGENYLPHVYAKGKGGPSVNMPDKVNTSAKQYGNLDKERLSTNDSYQRTPQVLQEYLDKASQRIAHAEHFGAKNEISDNLLSRIGAEGGDQGTADKAFANYIRKPFENTTAAKIGGKIRAGFGVARLPLAAVSHLGQTSNTAVDTGIANTLKAWGKHIAGNPADKDFVDRTGVINPQSLGHYSQNYTSVGSKAANKLTAPGLTQVMKVNRSVTALAYRNYASNLAAKGDEATLRALGVKGDIGETLTDEQQLQAARGGVEKTMFTGSSAQTPIGAETNKGRFIGQYRTAYAYPQTKFIANSILKPAAKGNIAPLLRYLGVSGGVTAATVAGKDAVTGRQETPGEIAADTVASLGGIPGEMLNSAIQYGASNPVGTIAGAVAPAAGEAVKLATAAGQSVQSKSVKPIERYGLGLVPVAGHRLQETLTPTKAQQKTAAAPAAPAAPGTGNPLTDIASSVGSFVNGIFHPAPPDPATTEIARLTNDAGTSFSPGQTKALQSKSVGPIAHTLLKDELYQAADDQTKASMLKSVLNGTATKGVNSSLKDNDKQALVDYKIQTGDDKKAWLDDNGNASKYYTALYHNAVANKSINEKLDNDLSNTKSLKYKMVAAQVDEKYNADPELKSTYGSITQSKFTSLLNPKSTTYDPDTAQTLYDYDQARVAAGLPPKYNMKVVQKALDKAAAAGSDKAPKSFTFASMPSSLIGSGSGSGSSSSKYATASSLYTPIASLKTPAAATIPNGRSISVSKIQTL